ncbi:zinc ABC transporter substrate-binding protein [Enterococcus sp. JM4C]|uniref:metal ABC transporter substrate-binding protein n=1 Tax=Candidatus Enterococcus huntleyi TaxID=1857217 RepID=UPI0013796BAC|nr:metal ABC transporter substrate-binding protein [Enterococcus sp. JM4C]KAF1295217.1 zinc ABC transporter substrate-binding protein [Enterococcus sp. JM4C]
MKKVQLLASLFVGMLVLTACGDKQNTAEKANSDKLQVMTTFYPMYEFTKNIVGDAGEVELLIPAGTEAHDYEPSAKDLAKISEADAFVYNSSEFETWVANVEKNLSDNLLIEAASTIELAEGEESDAHDHDHEGEEHDHEAEDHEHEGEEAHDHEAEEAHTHALDPHVWLDPTLAIKEVENISAQLSEKYPEKKELFEKNAASYITELKELDAEFQAAFKDAKNKTFVTQHAAFGYLAKQYGLTQEAISGVSPDQEPSPSRLAELKHYVEDHEVKVIYFEENASSKVAETLSNETGVELAVLNPLESLTNKQIEQGKTYITGMKENLKALQKSIR